ncbi:MAG TPA: DUF2975 domain-containing protein [Thermomicrobiales bacterium]|jgi:hypothetical protein
MKRSSTLFLKTVLILVALGTLALMIRLPQTEGRAKNLDLISIYSDPFIIYIYIASIPFFTAFYQAFKLLGYVDRDTIFSQVSVNAVRNIQYCAVAIVGFILGAEAFLFIVMRGTGDDITGGITMGIIITSISIVIATAAAVFQKLLQNAVAIKAENDLTV